jgi:hypothetical protein
MIHPDMELKYVDPEIGFGVFATRFIARGTLVWVSDDLDQVLTPQRVSGLDRERQALVDRYAYRDAAGNHVLRWDLARYINHSFKPSSVGTAYGLDLALRDIFPGEELTCDYGTMNLSLPFCTRADPESPEARARELLAHAAHYDALALAALEDYEDVPQPLAGLVRPEHQEKLLVAARQGVLLDSLSTTFCGVPVASPS